MLEANHASSTVGLKLSGTIRLDHVCAEGQTRHNNDFGCGHEVLVIAGSRQNGSVNGNLGTYTTLCEEHQCSIIQAALENAHAIRRRFDNALACYAEGQREKEELAMQKKIDASREEYIVGGYFYEMCHFDRCWKTKRVARAQFGVLSSEAARTAPHSYAWIGLDASTPSVEKEWQGVYCHTFADKLVFSCHTIGKRTHST